MVYGKYRRSYRKSYRTRRTLSTRNIFNNKGSRSQANQIFRLNRKVNNIYRQCKPELKIKTTEPQSYTQSAYGFTDINPSDVHVYFNDSRDPSHDMSIQLPENGDGDDDLVGNVCNMKDITTYINIKYELIKDIRLNSLPQEFSDQSMIRFIFFLSRTPNDDVVEPSDLFDLTKPNTLSGEMNGQTLGSYPPGYNLNTVLPLNPGTASKYIILKDIRCKLGVLNPDKQLKIRIPLGKYAKFIKDQYTIFGKGTIRCFAITSSLDVKGIRDSENNYIYAVPQFRVNWFSKIAYTDP